MDYSRRRGPGLLASHDLVADGRDPIRLVRLAAERDRRGWSAAGLYLDDDVARLAGLCRHDGQGAGVAPQPGEYFPAVVPRGCRGWDDEGVVELTHAGPRAG